MTHDAVFTLDCGSDAEARRILTVLQGERFQSDRLQWTILRQGSKVLIQMHAQDVVTLRASVNSCLRNVQLMDSIKEVE